MTIPFLTGTPLDIVSGILAAIQAAPQIESLAVDGYNFIAGLFKAGMISKEVQDAAKLHMDSIRALRDAGIVPLAWQVSTAPKPAVVVAPVVPA